MQTAPSIDSTEPTPCEPDGPIVEVRIRGTEVLTLCGSNALVSPLALPDRAMVAAALSSALALTLNGLATDVTVLAEPAGSA